VSWRIRVEHYSHYLYAGLVDSSYNEARITPMTTPWQMVLDARVEVDPDNQPLRYLDYWGTVVHSFDLQQPHREMTIIGRSVVETAIPDEPGAQVGWAELQSERVRDDFAELLAPTVYVPVDPRLSEVAASLHGDRAPAAASLAAIAWVHDQITYIAGTTGVHTSAVEAWDGGSGVCQDFAHLALALVRSMGLPARYCSGYLHPDPGALVGPTHNGESHAWIEVWTGDWQALDPTIGEPIGERHVLVARGRDYADVTPIKGIFHGGPTAQLDVKVNLTRLG
jgi:transglutaminase-like putative cysteine protease